MNLVGGDSMKKSVKIVILFILITMCVNIINPSKTYAAAWWEHIIDFFTEDRIYTEPGQNKGNGSEDDTFDDIINDAEAFENLEGSSLGTDSLFSTNSGTELVIDTGALQGTSSKMYTAFMIIATAATVIVGAILGIKFMYGSIEEQADVKKLLKPYLIGCLVVFGSFGIWKLVLSILAEV